RKRVTISGRNLSPSLPMVFRVIWSRMKPTSSSAMLCPREGTTLALRVVKYQNPAATSSATTSTRVYWVIPEVIGRPKSTHGVGKKRLVPGASKPHPKSLKRWQPSSPAALYMTSALTANPFVVTQLNPRFIGPCRAALGEPPATGLDVQDRTYWVMIR